MTAQRVCVKISYPGPDYAANYQHYWYMQRHLTQQFEWRDTGQHLPDWAWLTPEQAMLYILQHGGVVHTPSSWCVSK
jgi:hypothetical protein